MPPFSLDLLSPCATAQALTPELVTIALKSRAIPIMGRMHSTTAVVILGYQCCRLFCYRFCRQVRRHRQLYLALVMAFGGCRCHQVTPLRAFLRFALMGQIRNLCNDILLLPSKCQSPRALRFRVGPLQEDHYTTLVRTVAPTSGNVAGDDFQGTEGCIN